MQYCVHILSKKHLFKQEFFPVFKIQDMKHLMNGEIFNWASHIWFPMMQSPEALDSVHPYTTLKYSFEFREYTKFSNRKQDWDISMESKPGWRTLEMEGLYVKHMKVMDNKA